MKLHKLTIPIFLLVVATGITSCSKKGCTNENATNYDSDANKDDGSCELPVETEESEKADISTLKDKFYNTNVSFVINDQNIVISTTDEPDHKSMYYPTNHALYEDYTESNSNFKKNPNEIAAQNYVFTIPRFPSEATSKSSTDYDAIGVAINGVVFYNQVAAPGDDIQDELWTFDQYEGHPTNTGSYHHHTEPVYLTQTKGSDAFIGLLLDGFPVYGPLEDGVTLTSSDLDDYHGHFGPTAEFPDGIYHYHVTDDLPWINGGQYYGAPGSFTN